MKLSLCLAVCIVFVASAAMAVEKGTIETGGGLDLHLSPSPWVLGANMHLLYYMNPMLGIGPYWWLQKSGKPEGAEDSPPTYYAIGALGKIYLPMAWREGKMTPFVEAGLGITTVPKGMNDTENKTEFMARVGFDYWLTDKWTVWTAYQADKVFIDGYDWQSSIKIGIATFLMK
jgi:hypothetical protein